jgi:23S rRNA (uracil1939-C5)-methyltransferase
MHPVINDVLASLQGQLRQRLHQVAVRYGVLTEQLLINPKLQVEGFDRPTGQEYYEEELCGRKFRVAAASFFQVNTPQAEHMVKYVIQRLNLDKNGTLADIYCGVGTFGLVIAEKVARVIGIEDSAAALLDASYNARSLTNVEFIRGAAENVLAELDAKVDAAIIDPPRVGCKAEVIEALCRLCPDKIVYVSCDPATLARDLKLFCSDERYMITDIQPVDMFPQTYHIETVVTLQPL